VAAYLNNPEREGGFIFYPAGEISFFEKDTVVDPASLFPIPHAYLVRQQISSDYRWLGEMPSGFPAALINAAKKSTLMSPAEKRRIHEIMSEKI